MTNLEGHHSWLYTYIPQSPICPIGIISANWAHLYAWLYPVAKCRVHTSNASHWRCQIDDIVQEARFKLLKYMQRAQKGEAAPVLAIQHLIIKIAHNYFHDLVRKESCLARFEVYDHRSLEHVAEIAPNTILQIWLFIGLSNRIKKCIPEEERIALIRNLAQRISFGKTMTPLQQAFPVQSTHLWDHRRLISPNMIERDCRQCTSVVSSTSTLALRQPGALVA